jgi:hypothetical protein
VIAFVAKSSLALGDRFGDLAIMTPMSVTDPEALANLYPEAAS